MFMVSVKRRICEGRWTAVECGIDHEKRPNNWNQSYCRIEEGIASNRYEGRQKSCPAVRDFATRCRRIVQGRRAYLHRLTTDSLVTYGKANTNIALPDLGCRISGANSAGISVDQLPPPVPAGMAMYCFPFTRYVIGKPCAEVIRRVCQRIFPVVASYAYM